VRGASRAGRASRTSDPTRASRVVVIGAGLAGLSAACYLRADGHDVTVLEREPLPGGRSTRITQDGFAFDIGATVLTMPGLIDHALRQVGTTVERAIPMRRLDPAYLARYADGSTLRVRGDRDSMREEIRRACGDRDADAFDPFVAWLERLYDLELPHFIDANLDRPWHLARHPLAAAELLATGAFGSLDRAVARRFADDRLRKLFTFQAMYAGLAPTDALAIYAVITYMDSIAGVYAPEGGMYAVPRAMADAAAGAGVTFHYDTTVIALARSGGRISGVQLATGDVVPADAVVCTLDLPTAYRLLLPDLSPPRVLRRAKYAPSAAVWHLGVRGPAPDGAAHHNIHFADAWDSAFDELIDQRRMMTDPSRLVTIPTVDDPALAPAGCSTLYVLEPVPNLGGPTDWRTETPRLRDRLLNFLETQGYPTDIVTERLYTPLDWAAMGMAEGTPFALAHTFGQTGPFRPGNREKRLPGLFFAGSGTTPGVGVPMVLISGKLAAARVREYSR